MGKYTEQAKLAAVQDYCSGSADFREVAHRHNVDFSSLRQCVAAYQVHGVAGLKEKKLQRYSNDFKLSVLKRICYDNATMESFFGTLKSEFFI